MSGCSACRALGGTCSNCHTIRLREANAHIHVSRSKSRQLHRTLRLFLVRPARPLRCRSVSLAHNTALAHQRPRASISAVCGAALRHRRVQSEFGEGCGLRSCRNESRAAGGMRRNTRVALGCAVVEAVGCVTPASRGRRNSAGFGCSGSFLLSLNDGLGWG